MSKPRCRDCGRVVETFESLPGSGHMFTPRYCRRCLARRDDHQMQENRQ